MLSDARVPGMEVQKVKALIDEGRLQEAKACCMLVCEKSPFDVNARFLLGGILARLGEAAQALACYEKVVALSPGLVAAHINLGLMLRRLGRLNEAESSCLHAMELAPGMAEPLVALGLVYADQGCLEKAEKVLKGALSLRSPMAAGIHNNLGGVLREQGRLGDAAAEYRQALQQLPADADAHNNLGNVLKEMGELDEAIASYQRALNINPAHLEARSNLLLALNCATGYTREEIFLQHQAWARVHERISGGAVTSRACRKNLKSPMRVGYVSPDLYAHAVAHFIEPILVAHDPSRVEVFCYADLVREDETTARLRGHAHHWRDIHGMADKQVADQIRSDQIDILVDLAGHTARNRLGVFSLKPAPLQISYLGYPNTTGLSTINYRLTDAWADPPGDSDIFHTEALVRLPSGFLCYRPPVDSPDTASLPAIRNGYITFGCFNNVAKLTQTAVKLWSEILVAVADSRLVLQSRQLADTAIQRRLYAAFASNGIGPERVSMLGTVRGTRAQLERYHEIDLCFDSFPYNGTTTTCESLWMGVPVITLAGDRHVSRVGVSLLSQLGLNDWIAGSREEYHRLAVAHASDLDVLARVRGGLRSRMQNSPLMDEVNFTRAIEGVYQDMMSQLCGGKL